MIKLTIMLKRRADLTREQFSEYWFNEHAPKIGSLPNVRGVVKRYIQQVALDDIPAGLPLAEFDGMAELWFDDLQSAMTIMGSQEYIETIPADEPNFIDPLATRLMITQERACI